MADGAGVSEREFRELQTLCRALAGAVEQLQAEVARLRQERTKARPADVELVRQVFHIFGDKGVSAQDVARGAGKNKALTVAIHAAVGSHASVRQIGKRFQKLAGQDLADFHLQRVGGDRDGATWCVKKREFETLPNSQTA